MHEEEGFCYARIGSIMSEGENGEENSKVEGVGFKVMGVFEVHGEDQLPG
jgi:hypothetical protein